MSIILSPVALRNHLEEDLHPDAVFAYFDRIQVWLPYRLHRAEISRLRSQCRTHPYRKERKVLHVGKPWERHPDRRYRQRLELYRPTREALRFLERIRPTLVNEVELAVDLAFDDFAQVEAADEVMTAHSRKL
jgi:hypothetical protein